MFLCDNAALNLRFFFLSKSWLATNNFERDFVDILFFCTFRLVLELKGVGLIGKCLFEVIKIAILSILLCFESSFG